MNAVPTNYLINVNANPQDLIRTIMNTIPNEAPIIPNGSPNYEAGAVSDNYYINQSIYSDAI